ncbi:MAG TPA: hypothetical protein VGW75_03330 [Solirubrobacteraceae bacterium]|jgi:hypothetical protein|nr:hypothetical protein [Solirubrobacteraceae bacterium]
MRIENQGDGIVHVALSPEGEWARSSAPHALLIVDHDPSGAIIGFTFAGPLARTALAEGVPAALEQAVSDELLAGVTVHDEATPLFERDAIDALRRAVEDAIERLVVTG